MSGRDETEDTAAELVDWLADNGVGLARWPGGVARPVPCEDARNLIQRFLDGARGQR